ncbi:hypothetical protein EVAR_103717_1 [Eumeta japonica]|uniref:BESS domain-containing protein n=1 Tax=Eumeta variegata TaxID=151549 RepID=A0A4C1ZIZ8_EUMVA|nr:hypothetical protein EVAR_103717_1 [Eumeta japonica]
MKAELKKEGPGVMNLPIISFASNSERESMSSVQEYAEIHMDHAQEDKQENEEDHEYTQENIQERLAGQGKLTKKKASIPSLSLPQTPIRKFFDSMADTVECFPPNLQAEVRLKVCQLVTEAELRLYSQF